MGSNMSWKLILYDTVRGKHTNLTLPKTFLSPNPEIVGVPEIANHKSFLQ